VYRVLIAATVIVLILPASIAARWRLTNRRRTLLSCLSAAPHGLWFCRSSRRDRRQSILSLRAANLPYSTDSAWLVHALTNAFFCWRPCL